MSEVDPFYKDDVLPAFLEKVQQLWGNDIIYLGTKNPLITRPAPVKTLDDAKKLLKETLHYIQIEDAESAALYERIKDFLE